MEIFYVIDGDGFRHWYAQRSHAFNYCRVLAEKAYQEEAVRYKTQTVKQMPKQADYSPTGKHFPEIFSESFNLTIEGVCELLNRVE